MVCQVMLLSQLSKFRSCNYLWSDTMPWRAKANTIELAHHKIHVRGLPGTGLTNTGRHRATQTDKQETIKTSVNAGPICHFGLGYVLIRSKLVLWLLHTFTFKSRKAITHGKPD